MSEKISQKTFRQSVFMTLLKNLVIDKGSVTITYGEVYDGDSQWVINLPDTHYICGEGIGGETIEKVITNAWHEVQNGGDSFPAHDDLERLDNV